MEEIGYLPVNANGANLFFQVVNARYEKASTVLTSNKSFKEWGKVFGDQVVASALLDRLRQYRGRDLPEDPPPPRRRGRRPKAQEASA